jgi:alginate O-acetyltransferase complex protein AlgJ
MPYQEVTTAYLHDTGDKTQIWVRIEFKPWVGFVDGMSDEYNDGFKAVYGRLAIDNIDKNIMDSAVSWIRTDYCGKVLTKAETIDWANNLASYWYPKFNTDIVDMTGLTQWPDDQTEDEIVKELKGFIVKNPAVVIRGNPFESVLYNVFVVDFANPAELDNSATVTN